MRCAVFCGLAAVAILGGTRGVHAQNALGSGNALDANPMVGVRGNNSIADRFVDTRVRNLMVTSSVPSGRGFRGTIGYTAPRDFREETGSDDTFAFRADSALSAGSLTRFGSEYDQLRFGGGMDRATYRRSSTVTDLPSQRGQALDSQRTQASEIRLDRFIPASSTLNAPQLESQPQIVGVLAGEPGAGQAASIVEASPLRGLQTIEQATAQRSVAAGLSVYDRLQLERDASRGLDQLPPGERFATSFDDESLRSRAEAIQRARDEQVRDGLTDPRRVEGLNDPLRQETRTGEADPDAEYEAVLARIAERYAEAQNVTWNMQTRVIDLLGEDYEELKQRLAGTAAPTDAAEDEPEVIDPTAVPGATPATEDDRLRRLLPSRRRAAEQAEADAEDEDGEADTEGLRRFGIVLKHGKKVDQFVSEKDQGRFQQLVRTAEERLQDGEYFWAERRFIRALRFIPGHPMATAGLGHSQLGAGLYRSAALTLRGLLTSQPEMIDIRYADTLLPGRVRLDVAVDEIRERAGAPGAASLSGFLLAYIGHQTQDADLVREGLDAMADADADDPLLVVLREVWQAD